MLDSLTLRIENGALWHDPNVCFHRQEYNIASNGRALVESAARGWEGLGAMGLRSPGVSEGELFVFREECMFEAHVH